MKKILFCSVGLLIITGCALAYNSFDKRIEQCVAGRGCCSSHRGVCGCQNGRSKCCDGTLSPSCHCLKDDVKGTEI